jgi:prolyl-tRNA editing enzyme YbaK/EbsC (Cys-tRNA(Pro) deacylase)
VFTDRQFQQAKHSRQVYHALGTPSHQDFKTIIMSNQIKKLPVTVQTDKAKTHTEDDN